MILDSVSWNEDYVRESAADGGHQEKLERVVGRNNTVALDGAPWDEDHVRAHAAAGGLPEEVERWLAEHG